jgi:hypothetical protein
MAEITPSWPENVDLKIGTTEKERQTRDSTIEFYIVAAPKNRIEVAADSCSGSYRREK